MGGAGASYDVFSSYQGGIMPRWMLWPQALEEVLASCRAVAFFVGPQGVGPWQQREQYLALSRQARAPTFPVIPVLLPGADPALGFLSQNTWLTCGRGWMTPSLWKY